MKRHLTLALVLILLFLAEELKSQGFEGKIIYRTVVEKPENSNISEEQFDMMYKGMDSIAILYLKNSRYKLVTLDAKSNDPKTVNLYDPDTKKSYSYMAGQNEMCMWGDAAMGNKETPSISTNIKDTITILGTKCHSMTIDYGNGNKTKFYFSNEYDVDVSSVEKSAYGFLEYIFESGSLPLKIISTGNGAPHNMVLIAKGIINEKVDDKTFELPEFKQMMKSPY